MKVIATTFIKNAKMGLLEKSKIWSDTMVNNMTMAILMILLAIKMVPNKTRGLLSRLMIA